MSGKCDIIGASGVDDSRQRLLGWRSESMPHEITIPYGFCRCGCGQMTSIAKKSNKKYGHTKGVPVRFRPGHWAFKRQSIEDAMPFKVQGIYCRFIRLTQGQISVVSISDYERFARFKWYARRDKNKKTFYAARQKEGDEKSPRILMHREILNLGPFDPIKVDHRDCNGVMNIFPNLRVATLAQNAQNSPTQRNNTSGCKGVNFHKATSRWVARIAVNGHRKSLGYFSTKAPAFEAYKKAAVELHGEFANLN